MADNGCISAEVPSDEDPGNPSEGNPFGEGPFARFWRRRRAEIDSIAVEFSRESGCPMDLLAFGADVQRTYTVKVPGLYERLGWTTSKRQPRMLRRTVAKVAGEAAAAILSGLVDERAAAGAAWRARGTDLAKDDVDDAGSSAAWEVRNLLKSQPDRSWTDWQLGAYSFKSGSNEVHDLLTRKGSPLPVLDRVVDEAVVDDPAMDWEVRLVIALGLDELTLAEIVSQNLIAEAGKVVPTVVRFTSGVLLALSATGADWMPPSTKETADRVGEVVWMVWCIADAEFEAIASSGRFKDVYRQRHPGRRWLRDSPLVFEGVAQALVEAGAPHSLVEAARVAESRAIEGRDRATREGRTNDAARKFHERKVGMVTGRVADAINSEGVPLDDNELWAMIVECAADLLAADEAGGHLHPDRDWDRDGIDAWLDANRTRLLNEVKVVIEAMMGNVEDAL